MTNHSEEIIEAMARAIDAPAWESFDNDGADNENKFDRLFRETSVAQAGRAFAALCASLDKLDVWQWPEELKAAASRPVVRMRQCALEIVNPPYVTEWKRHPPSARELADKINQIPLFDIPCSASSGSGSAA